MGMMLPGGLAMADRAPDRDGLPLDVLTVPLGPVLAWWPAGLVVTTRLQGDVISGATVSVLPTPAGCEPFWVRPWIQADRGTPVTVGEAGRWGTARRLDSAATLLAVAGWEDEAVAARRLRDEVLADEQDIDLDARLDRWGRRVAGSRLLRWSLREVGRIAEETSAAFGLMGDTHDRLLALVAEIRDTDRGDQSRLQPSAYVEGQLRRDRWIIDALPALLTGAELAEARLIVAGLDPDAELLAWASAATEAAHD